MIQISGLYKFYGRQVVFEDVSFAVNSGERIGITGRNGSGKTTLFRLILGEERPDEGSILVPKGYRIGYLNQHIAFKADTVLKEAELSIPPSDTGIDQTYKAKIVLTGIGFEEADFNRDPYLLSGGFQVRLNLAKTILNDPDLLLLDEPTNYLDIVSIRWLRQFLRAWKKELMIITHDREFMDSVSTHTVGIHRQKVKKIEGSTHKLYEQIIMEEEIYEQTRLNDDKKRREIQEFIDRFRAKATKARQVQSRIKRLQKREKSAELRDIKNLEFEFNAEPFRGRYLIDVQNLSFSYDKNSLPLISNLTFNIAARDRIAIIGKNGRGKTTLLNLLADEVMPDKGCVIHNPKLKLAYFGQTNIQRLDPQKTVAEEIIDAMDEDNIRKARTIAGIMMFEGDNSLKKVSVLSGGEKSRVLLGKLIVRPANLLLLDEPTNHLDMDSIDSLMQAIESFEGAVVIVTHSEMILKAVADRLIVFDDNEVSVFEGGYQDFIDRIGWKDERLTLQPDSPKSDNGSALNKRDLRRKKAEIINARYRTLNPIQQRIAEIEETIVSLEYQIKEDTEKLVVSSQNGGWQECHSLSKSLKKNKGEIDRLFDELAALTERFQEKSEEFERMLLQFNNAAVK